MTDYDNFKKHVLKRIPLTADELEEFCQAFQLMKVKKRQFIIQPEFTARHRYYVVDGSFRAYVVGDGGEEHTIQFAITDWWISDYNSYIFQQPASMFVMALTDSTVLKIEYDTEQRLKHSRHSFETFFRILAENTAAYMARRVITNLTKTAEQRYDEFMTRYSAVAARVPQYALASFLGMTTEYLSRLRRNKAMPKS